MYLELKGILRTTKPTERRASNAANANSDRGPKTSIERVASKAADRGVAIRSAARARVSAGRGEDGDPRVFLAALGTVDLAL